MRVEELGRWDALVVMSGDGLMHEVRPAGRDWVWGWGTCYPG